MSPSPRERVPGCTFCDIVAHEVPTDLVLDESEVTAFLDRRPVFPGHVLVVPRRHFETLVDLPLPLVEPLFATTARVAAAVTKAMEADGTLVLMNNRVSQSVPHLHIHIMPRVKGDDVNLNWEPKPGDMAAIKAVYEKLKAAL